MRLIVPYSLIALLLIAAGFPFDTAGGIALLGLGLGCVGVVAAYLGGGPRLLGKRGDGTIAAWSLLVNFTFHVLNNALFTVYRAMTSETMAHEVRPGLFLGRRVTRWDVKRFAPLGVRSVLDLTAEFSQPEHVRDGGAELYVEPVLDTRPPTVDQLARAVAWIEQARGRGPVYVHCAYGHSRSATVVIAWMIAHGDAPGLPEALATLKAIRPRVRLDPGQGEAITDYLDSLGTVRRL